MSQLIKIGLLAKRSKISVEALRFYESEGLLTPKQRTTTGYRLYSFEDEQKLHFILHAKKVGFSLQDIKQLLSLRTNKDSHTCEDVKSYTGAKMQEIESKILDLQKMQQALTNLYHACCGGSESAENCTILNSLDDPELFSFENDHVNTKVC
jgi:MerR family Zn(II)-responsive transcriptional regulator of zntA